MKKKHIEKKKNFLFEKENLYLIPALGIILGIFVLPFLNRGWIGSYIISIYVILSTLYVYINELTDCYKETKRYKNLPDYVKKDLRLQHCLAPLCYILLSLIFLPIVLFALFNYWTIYPLHWGILGITFISVIIFDHFDDIQEENEEVCDGYHCWGDYL